MPQTFPPVIQTSSTLKRNYAPTLSDAQDKGVEDRHTFKAARAKAHRDLDDDLRKRFQQKMFPSQIFTCSSDVT
jgi:hypothetical protein